MQTVRHFFYRQSVRRALWTVLGVLSSIVFLFPLYWILASSVKTDAEIFQRPPTIWPHLITLEGYLGQLTGKYSILISAKNSFLIATLAMLLSVCLAVPAAYGISRFKIPGGSIIIMCFLITQMLPSSLVLTPLYLSFSKVHFLNTYLAPIFSVATITIPFTLLLLRPMFMACPKEIEEAARIDGCNQLKTFLRIVLPIVKPGFITCACFGFVHGWNDLVYSMTFNSDKNLFPMTTAIYSLMSEYGIRWNWIMAYGCILVLPPALIFILAQKYVISGITGGAVKG